MTLAEKIQEVNESEDPRELFSLAENLLAGTAVEGKAGAPIQFTYADMRNLFKVVGGIDADRFEYLMRLADSYIPQ